MDPKAATETPHFYGPILETDPEGHSQYHQQWIPENAFPEEVLQPVRKRGQPLRVGRERDGVGGSWNGIVIDSETGERRGGTHPDGNGCALGE